MVNTKRPSTKELTSRISEAQAALSDRRVVAVNAGKFAAQLVGLGIQDQDELLRAVGEALKKLTPGTYSGRYPPTKCLEAGFEGHEMFAFVVDSVVLGTRIYIKFVLKKGHLGLVSFHETTEGAYR